MNDESNDDRPFRAEDLKPVTIGGTHADRIAKLEQRVDAWARESDTTDERVDRLAERVDELEQQCMSLDPGWAPREPPKPAGPFRPSAYDVEVDLRMTLGQLARRVEELERLASGGDEGDEVARAFVDAALDGDAAIARAAGREIRARKRYVPPTLEQLENREVDLVEPRVYTNEKGEVAVERKADRAATRARRPSDAGLGLQAKLEQLVERWRGLAAACREKDRTSQRFERDIADAYETCADELFALLEQEAR